MQDPNLPYQEHPSFSANSAQQSQSIHQHFGETVGSVETAHRHLPSQRPQLNRIQPQTRLQSLSLRLGSEAPDYSVKQNLHDQSGAVWQRRSQQAPTTEPTTGQQPSQPAPVQYYPAQHDVVQQSPIQQSPTLQSPIIGHSFAPPADLGRLNRAQVQVQELSNPQVEAENYSNLYRNDSSIYRSPIDTLSVRSKKDSVHSTDANTSASDLQNSHPSLPQRDPNTNFDAFAPRSVASDELFQQTQQPEQPARDQQTARSTIVLRSQKIRPQPKAKPFNPPSFQLLTPDFNSYVGSPNVRPIQQSYDDSWQYTRVTKPQPSELELPNFEAPPSTIFEPFHASPAPQETVAEESNSDFEIESSQQEWQSAAEDFAVTPIQQPSNLPPPIPTQLPSPPAAVAFAPVAPAPVATFETDPFQSKGITRSANDIFASANAKSQPVKKEWVNRFADNAAKTSVPQPKVEKAIANPPVIKTASASHFNSYPSSLPNYRVESHQSQFDAGLATVASTSAQPIVKTPQIEASNDWLSPWWMLACLAPFALFLLLRKSREEDFDYEMESYGKQIHLPPEMLETPGYSKSDAIFSESDDFFMTERVVGGRRQRFKTEESQLNFNSEIKRVDRRNEVRDLDAKFASANVQQRGAELDPNSSPNFRIDTKKRTDSKSSNAGVARSTTNARTAEAQITEFRQITPGVKVPLRSSTKLSKKRRSKEQNERRQTHDNHEL